MNVPDQVAVMPLPNAILFPGVLLPLYIFEPRYRRMLADCLQAERMFAVALTRGSKTTQPYPVASVGIIRTSLMQPDGTSNLVLEGVARVEFLEYVQVRPYRIARVRRLESVATTLPSPRKQLVTAVRQLAKVRAALGSGLPESVLKSMLAVEDPAYLTDLVSYTLLMDCQQKQSLLETLDVGLRLNQLIELLQRQTRQFEFWKTLQGNLSNDDVGKN